MRVQLSIAKCVFYRNLQKQVYFIGTLSIATKTSVHFTGTKKMFCRLIMPEINYSTVDSRLSGPCLSGIKNDCSIKVLSIGVRSIRVFKPSSVYKCMGFNYLNYSLIRTLL